MFTGLIEEVGRISRVERQTESARLSIQASKVLEGTRLGDSIAVNGACLTVVSLTAGGFAVEAMPETLRHSTLGQAGPGTAVNLERSLAFGGRLGGHLVLGHVDATATIVSLRREGIAWLMTFTLPGEVAPCVAPKGSIAIDGISLTVTRVDQETFSVGVIPHTLKETTLGEAKPGLVVNLEADVLARYVLRTLQRLGGGTAPAGGGDLFDAADGRASAPGGLTEGWLREQGFA